MSPFSLSRRLALPLLALSWCGAAWAAPCGRPDIDATFPPDDAKSVPANALLSAHYGAPALYDDESVSLKNAAGDELAVTATFDDADALLRAVPEEPLAEGHYTLEWPGLRGVSGAGVGQGKKIGFSVQGGSDQAPPIFAGLAGVDWDLSRERDPCLDRLDDRFVFRLKVGTASDDAGVELLALSVFQTRDPLSPDQTAPAKVALRAWPRTGELEVRRPASRSGKTCFAAIAQDLVGSVSGGGEREACVETKLPPFFDGCNLAPRDSRSPPSALVVLLAALSVRRRGRGTGARLDSTRAG